MSHIVWFDEYDPAVRGCLGGKCASLGEMTRAGLPVPPGFAITTVAYRRLMHESGRRDEINALFDSVGDDADPAQLAQAAAMARAMVAEAPVPAGLADEITAACARIDEICNADAVPVAVRSSATCEDSPDASFAGEHDSYLWVRGADAVLDRVRSCWASIYTDRAIAYRKQLGYAHDTVDMCVAVQKMVRPRASGVAFTLNPQDGDRSQVAIDASWGFGEAVVSGEVTPDNFLVDKVLYVIVSRSLSKKEIEYTLSEDDTMVRVEVPAERQQVACLSDEEIRAVAKLARAAEKQYGRPQDVEWAVDTQPGPGTSVVLLQSRPETVWSRKSRQPVAAGDGDYLSSIVSTLVSPLHARSKND